jgi:hypothetical protein
MFITCATNEKEKNEVGYWIDLLLKLESKQHLGSEVMLEFELNNGKETFQVLGI